MKSICKEYYKNSKFNTKETIKFIVDLCNKDDYIVRAYAAYNFKCPVSVLIKLTYDSNASVRYNASNTLKLKAI